MFIIPNIFSYVIPKGHLSAGADPRGGGGGGARGPAPLALKK